MEAVYRGFLQGPGDRDDGLGAVLWSLWVQPTMKLHLKSSISAIPIVKILIFAEALMFYAPQCQALLKCLIS